MLHSKWPRLRSAATFCCPRGTRLYSSRNGDDRTLPDRPNYTVAPRGRTRTNDRRNTWNDWTPRPNRAVQQRQQAQRNLRRKLVEGKLSPAQQKEMAAALEGLEPEQFAAAGFEGLKFTDSESTAGTRRAGDGGQWSLLKRRSESLEPEDDLRDEQDLEEGETTNASAEKWPLLKRRGRSYEYMDPAGIPLNDSMDVVAEPADDSTDLVAATYEALAKKNGLAVSKAYTMLRIDGLSTSVHASDFYRIADNDLSKWNQSIKQVQQVRDRTTLEPTGTYNLTFSSALAATAYALRFQRLCDLAQVRARSRTGLWRSELPPGLVPDDATQDDLEAELAGLTVTPGVQPVTLTHRRVAAAPVGEKIRSLVANDGLGERPPVVLLDVAPAAPLDRVRSAVSQYGGGGGDDTAAEQLRAYPLAADLHAQLQRLTAQIGAVGQAPDGHEEHDEQFNEEQDEGVLEWNKWDSARKQNAAAEKKRHATLRKREGLRRVVRHMEGAALRRFVIAFRDVSEAQRFHRMWNARWLGGHDVPPPAGAPRHFVRTEVVDY